VLHLPSGAPRAAAVVCHPHPQYGGDMDNDVVMAIVDALVRSDVAALRFNFGGVGASEGRSSGQGIEEQCDVGAAEAALAAHVPADTPRAIVGYSFGAWVGTQAAVGLPRVSRVVAVGPPLAFFEFDFVGRLRARLDVVVGDRDQYCPRAALDRLTAAHPVGTAILVGADHFFVGFERAVGDAVAQFVIGP
jgi:alpha/beta superfamily hydrolase